MPTATSTSRRIATGIYRASSGTTLEARVKVHGQLFIKNFPAGTAIAVMRSWRNETRTNELYRGYDAAQRQYPKSPDGWCYIYVMRCGELFKIGRTTDPQQRTSEIATASPGVPRLVVAVPAHAALEQAIHERLAHTRRAGEWFAWSSELDVLIRRMKAGLNPVTFAWPDAAVVVPD